MGGTTEASTAPQVRKFVPHYLEFQAIQLDLSHAKLTYEKWGGEQSARQGDWLVLKDGETYTIEYESFAATCSPVEGPLSEGMFFKSAPVWMYVAEMDGVIATKEGTTAYAKGDAVVFNGEGLTDGYAMSLEKFNSLYTEA